MASGDEGCFCQPKTYRCEPECPHVSLQKLVHLMENAISAAYVDRQCLVLDDFLAACPCAFWAIDLPFVTRLMELLSKRLEDVPKFRRPFEVLLHKCRWPPMMARFSESSACMADLGEFFSFLGYLLVVLKGRELRDMAVQAVLCQLDAKTSTCLSTDERLATLDMRYRAAEKSQLPETVAQLWEIADGDFYEQLLRIGLALAKVSNAACQKMLTQNGLEFLLLKLVPENAMEEVAAYESHSVLHYDLFYKIAWALLTVLKGSGHDFRRQVKSPGQEALRRLRQALRIFTVKKGGEADRNSLTAVMVLVMTLFKKVETVQCRLADDIALLSVASELGTGGTWASLVRFTTQDLDYHFKKMLLSALEYLRPHTSALVVLDERKVMLGLLKLITPGLSMEWDPHCHRKLVVLALDNLRYIVPFFAPHFVASDGPLRLLMMVEYYRTEMYDPLALQTCLKTFHTLLSKSNDLWKCVDEEHVISIMIGICEKLLQQAVLSLVHQRSMACCFCILQLIFERRPPEYERAVALALAYMRRVLEPKAEDPVHDPKTLICFFDFLWDAVVWNDANLAAFNAKGGVYCVLDVIQISPHPVKIMALAVLVDMCEQGACIPQLVTWRGKGKKLVTLMLDIFRDENRRLGVKTTPKGTIADQELPLMGEQQWKETSSETKESDSSPAIADVLVSCRPKVYALWHLLNTRHKKTLQMINEHYRIFDGSLDHGDRVTMMLMENFLALKLGETWVELERDLESAGVVAMAVDQEIVKTLTRRHRSWSADLKSAQEEVLREQKLLDEASERRLYGLLRETRLASSLKAMHDLSYIARTTECMFRAMKKRRQCQQVEESLAYGDTVPDCKHRTFMDAILVTPVFGKVISVQTKKIAGQSSPRAEPPKAVDSDEEEQSIIGSEFEIASYRTHRSSKPKTEMD